MGELESRGYLDEERGNTDPYLTGMLDRMQFAAWEQCSS